VALPARNHDQPSLASLIERSAELKRALVGFALSPRFERQMEGFVLESGSDEIPDESEAIDAIDRFALQHTLANGRPYWTSSSPVGRISPRRTGRCCAAGATRWRGSSSSAARTGTRSSC